MDKLDVPQGTLDLMILTILAREPMHGYGISQRLTALSHEHFQLNPGSLFPSLYRLEQDGRLKAEWRPTENNRKAKYYRLTAAGKKQLEQHRQRWQRVTFAITKRTGGCMTLIHRLVSGARWLVHRRVAEQELDDELRSFVEMATADKVREGVPPAEARRQAILALGGVEPDQGTCSGVAIRRSAGRHRARRQACGPDVCEESRLQQP